MSVFNPMRADRLITLLLLLQARGRMTAGELAERLEVSPRTVYRDIGALSGAGVPVLADPGPGGGVHLLGGWRTELTGLTEPELEALLTTSSGPRLESALAKLTASLPGETGRRAAHMRERLLVDSAGWGSLAEALPQLRAVQDALFAERRLRLRYRPGEGRAAERVVDPLGLVLKAGTWYLLAAVGGEQRVFRLSRVEAAEALDEPAPRPGGFDLARAWRDRVEEWESGRAGYQVTVRVAPGTVPLLRRVAGTRLAADAGQGRFLLDFAAQPAAVAFLASFGPELEVLSPARLRQELASHGRRLAELYGSGSPA
jgi:predicted DNA-binding transcriptional regulator YafY